VDGVSDEAIGILAESYHGVSSPATALLFQQLGNAANRVAPDATAFSHRNARYDLVLLSGWSDPADADANIGWTRELWAALQPSSLGAVYINSAVDDDETTVPSAYGDDTYRRLTELKAKYDPTNFFKLNPNIKPAAV
jgi:hypothetical protein